MAKIKDRCGRKAREEKYITLWLAGPEDAQADRCCPFKRELIKRGPLTKRTPDERVLAQLIVS